MIGAGSVMGFFKIKRGLKITQSGPYCLTIGERGRKLSVNGAEKNDVG